MFNRFAALVAVGALLASGCGDSKVQTYKATGTLKIKGVSEIPAGLTLSLYSGEGVAASAPVNSDGSFSFGTYEAGDGAAEGKYKVVAGAGSVSSEEDMKKRMAGVATGTPEERMKASLGALAVVDLKYRDPSKTPLTIEVSTDESKNNFTLELDEPIDVLPGGGGVAPQ